MELKKMGKGLMVAGAAMAVFQFQASAVNYINITASDYANNPSWGWSGGPAWPDW